MPQDQKQFLAPFCTVFFFPIAPPQKPTLQPSEDCQELLNSQDYGRSGLSPQVSLGLENLSLCFLNQTKPLFLVQNPLFSQYKY